MQRRAHGRLGEVRRHALPEKERGLIDAIAAPAEPLEKVLPLEVAGHVRRALLGVALELREAGLLDRLRLLAVDLEEPDARAREPRRSRVEARAEEDDLTDHAGGRRQLPH